MMPALVILQKQHSIEKNVIAAILPSTKTRRDCIPGYLASYAIHSDLISSKINANIFYDDILKLNPKNFFPNFSAFYFFF